MAQVKNQDPLNPTDGVQFLTQLAQFWQLEQMIGMRADLGDIATELKPKIRQQQKTQEQKMFNSFSAALSALKAHSAAVDTVGNNLANVNTTGFKSSDVAFKDVVAESLSGHSETGMGVSRPTTVRNFSQGAIQSTSGALDSAMQGNGFFVVNDSAGQRLLTRDGSFTLDKAGYVVTLTGERVQQYAGGALSDIQVPTGTSAASPTTAVNLVANLNASAQVGDTFSTPIEAVDSLGNRHMLTFEFIKKTDNSWNYDVKIPAADIGAAGPGPVSIFAAPPTTTIDFDANGKMTAPAAPRHHQLTVASLADKAADLAITWSLLDSAGQPTVSQFAEASSVSKTNADGYPAAEVVSVANGRWR